MRKRIGFGLCLVLAGVAAGGLDYSVIYTEGSPYRRAGAGGREELQIGDTARSGDTIITGRGDYLEMEAAGMTVKVKESTVFTIQSYDEGGTQREAIGCVLGSLAFKTRSITGREPRLYTNSAIAGVRGTELVLYAGTDGSSLIVVEEGLVQVSAAGQEVNLGLGEAVEVATGQAPGTKFKALSREIDFSKWNQGKLEALLQDPVKAALNAEKQMQVFIEEIRKIDPLYKEQKALLDKEREKERELERQQGTEAMQKYHREVVIPIQKTTTRLILNIRYYSLSALSLRRYVSGRVYMLLKGRFLADPANRVWTGFLEVHERMLEAFEREVAGTYLVRADI